MKKHEKNKTIKKGEIKNIKTPKGVRRSDTDLRKAALQLLRGVWKTYVLSPSFPPKVCLKRSAVRLAEFDTYLQWLSCTTSSGKRSAYSWNYNTEKRSKVARDSSKKKVVGRSKNKRFVLPRNFGKIK